MSAEVDNEDIIKIIIQFLRESKLERSADELSREADVYLNAVEDTAKFKSHILKGEWDIVLSEIARMRLSFSTLTQIFSHIIYELRDDGEVELARRIMRNSEVMRELFEKEKVKYIELEAVLDNSQFDSARAYGSSKEGRRAEIAELIFGELHDIPKSRLMVLLGHALKWQNFSGMLPEHAKCDILGGSSRDLQIQVDEIVNTHARTIKLGKDSHPECAAFSPNGQFFATGSADGFIEIWNPHLGEIEQSLPYQKEVTLES